MLYTMASRGGDERRLLSLGDEFATWRERPPLLSPDGTRIALIGNTSALKIESVVGHEVHEIGSRVFSFAWSPDGQSIAFHETDTGNNSKIFVVNSDGSGLRSLGAGQWPAWSPGGDRIAFVAPNGKLYVMNADGSGRMLVYDGNGAVAYAPSWSQLGDRIAFFAASRLIVIASDGRLLYENFADYLVKPPQWSFDGSLIAFEGPNMFSVVRLGSMDRWSFQDRIDPGWSPIANELTASFDGPCQRNGIYRMSVPSTSRRLTLDCHIRGTAGPDALTGTPFRDIVTGLAGDDELLGADGEDRLIGGSGGDTLLGGQMTDRLEGGYGADILIGGSLTQDPFTGVGDFLFGGPGPDDLRGGPVTDILSGDTGNDVLRGGADTDTLFGGPGNDRILASGDSPEEHGRPVRDSVHCGAGRHDVVFVDRRDVVVGCETIHRR